MSNTFGTLFRFTSFGESHSHAIGGIIDGCPSGLSVPLSVIHHALALRRPNPSLHGNISTPRIEEDKVIFHSGIQYIDEETFITLGSPIAFSVLNMNIRPKDYTTTIFRPGHADYTYYQKYGNQGVTGGGRASGRETVARVIAGAIASVLLKHHDISVYAGTESLHGVYCTQYNYHDAYSKALYTLDEGILPQWNDIIKQIQEEGDSIGGTVALQALGLPAGLGEPIFDKLDARLAYALMSVGAVKGIEIGSGFSSTTKKGSEHNDAFKSTQNNAGGILGGISTGKPLYIRVAVKPIPSIAKEQEGVTLSGETVQFTINGRHDICAIPRIVPVLEHMVNITLADALLQNTTSTLRT